MVTAAQRAQRAKFARQAKNKTGKIGKKAASSHAPKGSGRPKGTTVAAGAKRKSVQRT